MMRNLWSQLTNKQRKDLRQLVRIAGRRAVLGRIWQAGLIFVPLDFGMPKTAIRQEWVSATRRAWHLADLLAKGHGSGAMRTSEETLAMELERYFRK